MPVGAAGNSVDMRRVIKKNIRRQEPGVNVAADVDAVIAVNSGKPGQTTTASSKRTQHVVQDSRAHRDAPEDDPKPEAERDR